MYVVTATRGDERSRSGLIRMGAIMLRSAAGRTRGITWVVVWDRCSGQHVADEQGRQLFSAIGSVCDEPPDRRLLVRHVCHNASVPNAGSRGGVVRNDGVTVALRDWTARGRAFSWLYFADDDNHYHPLLFDKLHAHRSAPGRQIAVWAAQTCSDNNRPASKSRSKFNCTADGQGLMDWGHYTGRLFELDVSMRVCERACGRVCWWWRSWRCIHTCMCACAGTVLALVRMRVRECVHVRACACMCVYPPLTAHACLPQFCEFALDMSMMEVNRPRHSFWGTSNSTPPHVKRIIRFQPSWKSGVAENRFLSAVLQAQFPDLMLPRDQRETDPVLRRTLNVPKVLSLFSVLPDGYSCVATRLRQDSVSLVLKAEHRLPPQHHPSGKPQGTATTTATAATTTATAATARQSAAAEPGRAADKLQAGRAAAWRQSRSPSGPLQAARPVSCALNRLPTAVTARVHLFAYIHAGDPALLAHWLRHYASLGLDLSRANITLDEHMDEEPSAATPNHRRMLVKASRELLHAYGVPFRAAHGYSSEAKTAAANAYMATLPRDALLVYPDLDELFHYPCNLEARLRQRRTANKTVVLSAAAHDRVAADWTLRPMEATAELAAAYPWACPLSQLIQDQTLNLHLAFRKLVLTPVVDARGRSVRYISSHQLVALPEAEELPSMTWGVPPFDHYRYTSMTVRNLVRKIELYRKATRTAHQSSIFNHSFPSAAKAVHKYEHEMSLFERRGDVWAVREDVSVQMRCLLRVNESSNESVQTRPAP